MKAVGAERIARLPRGRLLSGANPYHHTTVYAQPLLLGELASLDDFGPEFVPRFAERFGGAAFADRARSTLRDRPHPKFAEALLEAILAVERDIARRKQRIEVPTFSRIVERNDRLELVWESWSGDASRAVARAALAGLLELLPANLVTASLPRRDFAKQLRRLRGRARRNQWSTTAAVFAMVARQRGLPHKVLAGNYLIVGEGVQQQVISESSLGTRPQPGRWRTTSGPDLVTLSKGTLHRLLVVDGVLISALRCDPPRIVGDGATTPERGASVVDVTATVHERVRHAAVLAAAEHHWPLTGVDYLSEDVGKGGGRVAAVTPAPELHLHVLPEHGRLREVGDALLSVVFKGGSPATIPTAVLVGERGTRNAARALERYLRGSHAGVALATPGDVSIQGLPLERTSRGSHPGASFLLGDPRAAMLVATLSPKRIVERGLGLDRSRVVAILGSADVQASNAWREAVDVSLKAAQEAIVVGAEHPLLKSVLSGFEPTRILVVARHRAHAAVARHLDAGCMVVRPSADGAAIEVQRGNTVLASMPVAALLGTKAGAAGDPPGIALSTAAVAFALGTPGRVLPQLQTLRRLAKQPG